MDSISTDNDISSISTAVLSMDADVILSCFDANNALPRHHSILGLDVVEKNLKEHLPIDEDLGIAGSETPGSAYLTSSQFQGHTCTPTAQRRFSAFPCPISSH